jgi:subtilisin family serine protease
VEYAIMVKATLSFESVLLFKSSIEGDYTKVATTMNIPSGGVYNCTLFYSGQSRLGTILLIECLFDPSIPDSKRGRFAQNLVSLAVTASTTVAFALPPKFTVEKNLVISVILPVNVSMVKKRSAIPEIELNVDWPLDRLDQRTTAYDQIYAFLATGANTTAYIADTGVEETHPEFNQESIPRAFWLANTIDSLNQDCNGPFLLLLLLLLLSFASCNEY